MKMAQTAEESGNDSGKLEHHGREDSEYVRLVISDEPRAPEFDISQLQSGARIKAFIWWIKALIWCLVITILLLVFVKWGVPFLFEKVLYFSLFVLFVSFACFGAVYSFNQQVLHIPFCYMSSIHLRFSYLSLYFELSSVSGLGL
jgi:hypothetical protein